VGQEAGVLESEIVLRAGDGFSVRALLAEPPGAHRAAGVVIAPEIFGLMPWIRSVAQRFAQWGYRAAAVEVFARDPLHDPASRPSAELVARMERLDWKQAVADLRSAAHHLRGIGAPKVGVVGFCMGGTLALLASDHSFQAVVACYGRLRHAADPLAVVGRGRAPLLGIYGARDESIPLDSVDDLREAVASRPHSEVALFDAGHAFLNDTRMDRYADEAAALAWSKIEGFLLRTLG
jgi:carboxymethylenebutenolidase